MGNIAPPHETLYHLVILTHTRYFGRGKDWDAYNKELYPIFVQSALASLSLWLLRILLFPIYFPVFLVGFCIGLPALAICGLFEEWDTSFAENFVYVEGKVREVSDKHREPEPPFVAD